MKPLFITVLGLILISILITACIKGSPCGRDNEGYTVKFGVTDYLPDVLHSFDSLTPRSISLSFYPKNNSEIVVKKLNAENGEISIEKGQYDILIHTSDFYDIDANFYRSMENINLAEAHTRQKVGEDGVITISESDPLFIAHVENYVVGTPSDNIKVEFRPLVYTYRFCIKVEGLGYVKSAKAQVTGLYSSVHLKSGTHREEEIAQMVVNLSKSGGDRLCGEFRCFGSHQRSNVEHTITIALVNAAGETKTVRLNNLTAKIKALPNGGEIGIDEKIVIESGGTDGGFIPGVDDWDNDKRPLLI